MCKDLFCLFCDSDEVSLCADNAISPQDFYLKCNACETQGNSSKTITGAIDLWKVMCGSPMGYERPGLENYLWGTVN